MTDSEIKALAEEFAKNTVSKLFKAGSLTDAYYDVSFNARKEAFEAGYKAALSGTERVECYLPCSFSESEIFAGTEAGPLPLKLVTLTVVNPSKS